MRNTVILLAFVLTSCSALTKRQFTPPVSIYNWRACLLDTKNPTEVYCKGVRSRVGGKVIKIDSQPSWVVLSMDDFGEIIAFFRQYCAENISACKDVYRKIKKKGGK